MRAAGRIWWLTKSHTNSFLAGWCCALLVFVIPTGLWLGVACMVLCAGLGVAAMVFGVEADRDHAGNGITRREDMATDDTLLIMLTKGGLRDALLKWETQARDGGTCRTRAEVESLPVEQVADESTEHLWSLLSAE